MKNWKAILGVTGIFLLGMLAGGLVTMRVVRHTIARGPDGWRQAIVRRLSIELRLDREQRAQLGTIVRDAQEELKGVHAQVQPQVREVLDHAETKARAMLNPRQREKFDEIVAKQRAKWNP